MINSRDKYEIEEMINKKFEEHKESQKSSMGCFTFVMTMILGILFTSFVLMPIFLTISAVYLELVKRGLTPFQAINLAPLWSVQLAPMIADLILKLQ
jgi:hypothetical protein